MIRQLRNNVSHTRANEKEKRRRRRREEKKNREGKEGILLKESSGRRGQRFNRRKKSIGCTLAHRCGRSGERNALSCNRNDSFIARCNWHYYAWRDWHIVPCCYTSSTEISLSPSFLRLFSPSSFRFFPANDRDN